MGKQKWHKMGFHNTHKEAANEKKFHQSDIFDVRGRPVGKTRFQYKIKKEKGRWRPWGPKYMGYQLYMKRREKEKIKEKTSVRKMRKGRMI